MGSLVSFLSRSGAPDQSAPGRMLSASPHRGACTSAITHGGCALGVSWRAESKDAWLAIDGGFAAALMGSIDNIDEIAAAGAPALAEPGSRDPGRLLLAAFRAFGQETPRRLRGAYAAVVTDGTSLWSFRDHLGFAPLFYRDDERGLHLATEAKQVVAGARIPFEPDTQVVERIFYETYEGDEGCALRGVRRLPKASILVARPDSVRTSRYWDPELLLETARFSSAELRSRFDELMRQAVARTLTGSDVVALSGGIDSPAIAAFTAPEHRGTAGRPIGALSAVFPDLPSVDESKYVEIVAKALDIPLHTYRPTARPLDGLDRWVRLADTPFPTTSAAQAHELYRRAQALGYRSVLTGELAEFVIAMNPYLLAHLVRRRRLGALRRYVTKLRDARVPSVRIARQLAASVAPPFMFTIYGRFHKSRLRFPDWIDPERMRGRFDDTSVPRGQRWRDAQLAGLRGTDISLETDEVNQAFTGVRVRRPWADVDVWEFFLSLPAEVKFPDTRSKGLVRDLLRGTVPDAILDRRSKTYFDEHAMNHGDYVDLRNWLIDSEHHIGGVDYDRLTHHLENEDLDLPGFVWAKDLATAHAFLALWSKARR